MEEKAKQQKDISNLEVTIPSANEKKEYPALPELQYLTAKLASISEQSSQSGPRARFEYALTGEFDGRKAWCSVPLHTTISADTGLYGLIIQHLGVKELDIGKFKLSSIVGKSYEIVIESSPSKKDPKKIYQNVTKVRPITTAALENVEIETGNKKSKATRKSEIKKPAPAATVVEQEEVNEDAGNSGEESYELPF